MRPASGTGSPPRAPGQDAAMRSLRTPAQKSAPGRPLVASENLRSCPTGGVPEQKSRPPAAPRRSSDGTCEKPPMDRIRLPHGPRPAQRSCSPHYPHSRGMLEGADAVRSTLLLLPQGSTEPAGWSVTPVSRPTVHLQTGPCTCRRHRRVPSGRRLPLALHPDARQTLRRASEPHSSLALAGPGSIALLHDGRHVSRRTLSTRKDTTSQQPSTTRHCRERGVPGEFQIGRIGEILVGIDSRRPAAAA